ncbi:MAG: DUF1080 domain-containing protein [Phycisphaerae bacterium]|nr:DUF1080 domain-containing protein [Phycisphaerae bacterium]
MNDKQNGCRFVGRGAGVAAALLAATASVLLAGQGFVPLFNGKDLTGWKPTGKPEAWSVRNGMIECDGRGGGWLLTEKTYGDFILKLQYKVSPGCNSGVAIRCAPKKPGFTGMELQILDDFGGRANKHSSMSVYSSITVKKHMSRPAGQWNDVQVTCRGPKLKVIWNGELVQDVDLDAHRELAKRLRRGHIGVQDHGHYVWFRNIEVQDLGGEGGSEPPKQ